MESYSLYSSISQISSDDSMWCFEPATQESFTVCFIYAFNERSQRVTLWNSLRQIAQLPVLQNKPWLLLGDYNQILTSSEAYSLYTSDISPGGIADFNECLTDCGLFDLAYRGCFFTWSNKSPTSPRSRKLDRALINENWMERYPNSFAYFDAPGTSDHSPCLVTIKAEESRRKTRFTYFSFFSSHPDFHQLLADVWSTPVISSSPMSSLYQKLHSAKSCCKAINNSRFSGIEKRTREAFEELERIQLQVLISPTQPLFQAESVAPDSWLLLAAAEKKFFQLKSNVRWGSKGDLNTSFFHKSVKANLARNVIHFLTDPDNRRVFDSQSMKDMVVRFYTYLQGRSNPVVVPYGIDHIQEIHPYRFASSGTEELTKIPSADEIKSILFNLPKSKSPGPDGFSSEFFISSWELVGQDLINAVRHFFLTSEMPRQVNATVISPIPKVNGASSLTDFRPVSLCNTVYKIISKILASRLKSITQRLGPRQPSRICEGESSE